MVIIMLIAVLLSLWIARWHRRKSGGAALTGDSAIYITTDVATFIPVAIFLWNLLIYFLSNLYLYKILTGAVAAAPLAAGTPDSNTSSLTLAEAVAGPGEATLFIAVLIVFFRLIPIVWNSITTR